MGNKKLQIFGFWRLASWCKSFILSQLSLGLIVKDKLLNYVDITHTSISFMEIAFPQQLKIISYFHLLSYKLDWCHKIILLKKPWEVNEWENQCGAPLLPPLQCLVASVWGLSSPPACGGPFLSSCTSLFPGSQASLCIHPSPAHTFARGSLFFRSWEVTFPQNLLFSEWVFFSINSDIFISWAASWATMTLLSLAYSFANILFLDSYCYDFVASTV